MRAIGEPGTAIRAISSIAAAGRSSTSAWALRKGSGSRGSIARSPSAAGGCIANVSISGPSARSGASSSRPASSVPRNAALTIANERPRTGSGTSGSGGKWMMFAHEVISSGRPSSSAVHVRRTSVVRSKPKNSAPAYSSRTGTTANSSAVTTPKFPPPPRSAQNSSGSCAASVRTRWPSAVTISIAVTALVCSPCLRASQPTPPPSE